MEEVITNGFGAAGGPVGDTVKVAPSAIRRPVREAVRPAGFQPRDIGGGDAAWNRRAGDDTHVMVTCDGRLDGDPTRPEWTAGRYGDAGGFVEVTGLTLPEALDAVTILPTPRRVDGSLAEGTYPSLDEAMSDLA